MSVKARPPARVGSGDHGHTVKALKGSLVSGSVTVSLSKNVKRRIYKDEDISMTRLSQRSTLKSRVHTGYMVVQVVAAGNHNNNSRKTASKLTNQSVSILWGLLERVNMLTLCLLTIAMITVVYVSGVGIAQPLARQQQMRWISGFWAAHRSLALSLTT